MFMASVLVRSEPMARRKSKRKPPPKKKMTGNLDTQFTCPFCNHEKSCDVKMWVCGFRSIWKRWRIHDAFTLKGANPQHGDHFLQRLSGGVPDAHHLYPLETLSYGEAAAASWLIIGSFEVFYHINDIKHVWVFPNPSSTDLSEPVDVYSDWIDACEAANQ